MVSGGVPTDDREQLADEVVGYWDGSTYIAQNGLGKLICTTDTVVEVTR